MAAMASLHWLHRLLRRPWTRLGLGLAAALAVAGCGDDDVGDPPPAPPPRPAAAAAGAAGGPGSRNHLTEKPHIEDRVACPIPDQPSDPRDGKCDPKAPSCGEHLYCLPLAQGNYCEPCPERDGIRHAFKERDFDPEHNRDPFQSQLQPVGVDPVVNTGLTRKCPREDQLVATNYSYADLKLVGIVAQGTMRKVLMMDSSRLGHIIKRGDCVGKEKAVVKDIGIGYVTFQLDPEASAANQRAPEEYSVQLNPKQLSMNEPELSGPAPRAKTPPAASPQAAPPRTPPAAGASPPATGASPAGTGTPRAPGAAGPRAPGAAPAAGSPEVPVEAPPAAKQP